MINGVCSMCGYAAPPDILVGDEQTQKLEENRTIQPLTQSETRFSQVVPSYQSQFSGRLTVQQNSGDNISPKFAVPGAIIIRVAVYVLLGLLAVPTGRLIGAGITYNLNAERREREAESEKELAEFRAKDKLYFSLRGSITDAQSTYLRAVVEFAGAFEDLAIPDTDVTHLAQEVFEAEFALRNAERQRPRIAEMREELDISFDVRLLELEEKIDRQVQVAREYMNKVLGDQNNWTR